MLQALAPDLLAFLRRRAGTPDDAADMLAECYLVAWRQRRRIPADHVQARMWLFGVASNVVRNTRRSRHRHDALVDRLRETLDDGGSAPELPEVTEAIDRLPLDQAELVRLIHWEGFSVVEAAGVLGISESTTRGRYQRARTNLAEDPTIRAFASALTGRDT
jgi:RNA polymerase sigma-70 factor (ECF subfamily)